MRDIMLGWGQVFKISANADEIIFLVTVPNTGARKFRRWNSHHEKFRRGKFRRKEISPQENFAVGNFAVL